MKISANNILLPENNEITEVSLYKEQLLRYLEDYQIRLDHISNHYCSPKDKELAKIIIARNFDVKDPELQKNAECANNTIGERARQLVHMYLRKIMLILGNICECIIIDNCKRNPIVNMKCINYACFKGDINEEYNIPYALYTPFSPSHQRIVMISKNGVVSYKPNLFVHEFNHENKDIIWCKQENTEEVLQATISNTKYSHQARLQIKASTDYRYITKNIYRYRFAPIIYFDLNSDIIELQEWLYANKIDIYARSINDFNYKMMEECIWYFRLLAGHFSGLIDIRDFENTLGQAMNDGVMKYIFRADIKALLNNYSIVKSQSLLKSLHDIILDNNKNVIILDAVTT